MKDAETLALHRQLVGIRSVSHDEEEVCKFLLDFLESRGVEVQRLGNNIFARAGQGPRLLFNSHYDTVPPGPEWTRDPWEVTVEDGRVYGLGANDAKASVAAMVATLLSVHQQGGPCELGVLISSVEETGGEGTEWAWPQIRETFPAKAVIVGEPTNLQLAISQKGMLVVELQTRGSGGHAAHAAATQATSAVRRMACDLMKLEDLTLGTSHPELGVTTLEPTVLQGGEARNKVAERASCVLDLRTVPGLGHDEVVSLLRDSVDGDVVVQSDRLEPFGCAEDAPIVRAAQRARPSARTFGSRTMSDIVFFQGLDGIKVGPGQTERSHQPDEFVLEREIVAGAAFYLALIHEFAAERRSS